MLVSLSLFYFFFFKQKTAYEMRISDWSSDVCSSDLIEVPRDRAGSFDPQLIAKYQRRFPGFDDKIISMYARGMSTREITGHLRELYGIDASPDLISTLTDAVLEEVAAWQQRPLDPAYPLVFSSAARRVGEESGGTCRYRWV